MMEENRQESDYCAKILRKKAISGLQGGVNSLQNLLENSIIPPKGSALLCPAAVLVPVVDRGVHAHILLTRRADDHPHHAGQISFPGGKIAPQDETVEATALRETFEETGIESHHIDLLGQLDRHSTGTGFTIYPVVGIVQPTFNLKPCSREVAEIFEVPLSFVMNPDNYRQENIVWRGRLRAFYVIDYGSYRIWGATAAILKKLQERLYG